MDLLLTLHQDQTPLNIQDASLSVRSDGSIETGAFFADRQPDLSTRPSKVTDAARVP